MRKIIVLLLAFLFSVTIVSEAQIQHFEWQGSQREYLVRTPADYDEAMPVLFFLHGLGDNITRLDNEFHFQQVADKYHWVTVVPQALQQSGYTMWNAGLMSSNIDDSGFLIALLDSLAMHYPVDLDSVFFTGFSMGGFMTHRMAIEHGDRITACAPVSGLITHSLATQTTVPVRMLHIHGTSDPVVGYDGNSQYFGGNLGLSVEAILNYWKNANECFDEPVIDTFPDLKNDGLRFVRYTYDGAAQLQHIKVIGGNHTWYHSEDQYDIGYLTEIHKFFTVKDGGSTSINEQKHDALRLWPNPTSGQCTIEVKSTTSVELIDLQGHFLKTYTLNKGINQIDLTDIPEGLYLIKSEDGMVRKLLVK